MYIPCQYFPAHGRLPPKIMMSFSSNCDIQPLLSMLQKYLGSIHTHTFLKCSPWCPPSLLASLKHKKLVKIAKHITTHQVLWTMTCILAWGQRQTVAERLLLASDQSRQWAHKILGFPFNQFLVKTSPSCLLAGNPHNDGKTKDLDKGHICDR